MEGVGPYLTCDPLITLSSPSGSLPDISAPLLSSICFCLFIQLDLDSFLHLPLFLLLLHPHLLADYAVEERPSEIVLMQQLEEGGPDPLVFVLNANLLAMVKLVNCE